MIHQGHFVKGTRYLIEIPDLNRLYKICISHELTQMIYNKFNEFGKASSNRETHVTH